MKLIIETDETDKVSKHVRVSTRGMQILLDSLAGLDMQEPRRITRDAPDTPAIELLREMREEMQTGLLNSHWWMPKIDAVLKALVRR